MKRINVFSLTMLLLCAATIMQAQQFFFSSVRPSACAATDGILTIVPTQGVPPFTYQWSNSATSISLRNVGTGTYTATLTDSEGATVVHTHILNSETFDLRLDKMTPSGYCANNTGQITVETVAGQAPFQYSWSNGQTGQTATGLAVGSYTVTAVDATGCAAVGEFEVTYPAPGYSSWAIGSILANPTCANLNGGELMVSMPYSSYAPFTYLWNTGATTPTLTGVSAGNYIVTITDALGCSGQAYILVDNDLPTTGTSVCSNTSVGIVSATLTDATAPVTYTWTNGSWPTSQTGQSLSNLPSGYYYVQATDANGCTASNSAVVAIPTAAVQDQSPKCYSGNGGSAYCWVSNDTPVSYLWDNGDTDSWANTLSPGLHTVSVTTALGCNLTATVNIPQPLFPAVVITATPTAADCSNGVQGSLNISITGGTGNEIFYAYSDGGLVANDIADMASIKAGNYQLSAYTPTWSGCYGYLQVTVPDLSGFEPEVVRQEIDCTTGYGSAAVIGVTSNATYSWSNGATSAAIFNLTEGSYTVTVTGAGNCIFYGNVYLYKEDSLGTNLANCSGLVTGQLINDLGVTGCAGTTGIPFQLIRTSPSGALNFTDQNGFYSALLPAGSFDLAPANYDPMDFACPTNGSHNVNVTVGSTISGQDFHFYSPGTVDNRIVQQPLRTAQPGYPYSVRYELCNDGGAANAGTVGVDYANFFGTMSSVYFERHTGAFTLSSETTGTPNNKSNFNFASIAPGNCELFQADFTVPTTTPINTPFENTASASPNSGDPTPENNRSLVQSVVTGAYDPNSVSSFPARSGNPHDGGWILRDVDRSVKYQIQFQNTGNAPADLVIVRDTLDAAHNATTIRNIKVSHPVRVSFEDGNKVLVFKFPNINLPDSSSDYANSIGSIQYDVDLVPGLPLGTQIDKQAAIFFDFNAPVITNLNRLEVAETLPTVVPKSGEKSIVLIPNPADSYFGFFHDAPATLLMYNSLGDLVLTKNTDAGLTQIGIQQVPNGVYFLNISSGNTMKHSKLVVSH
jgi:hypothetical protein